MKPRWQRLFKEEFRDNEKPSLLEKRYKEASRPINSHLPRAPVKTLKDMTPEEKAEMERLYSK